ncbi:ABC transporter substrate-binding protein [Microbacterium testaceum]|uniref:ABC transporter substrate-binding protein n=1 Tax=Microbacterium testaceum TaxID=2033 RepID=UPI000734F9F0|nr:ABC transporter substrate-binding protein [Microbacterium testaceum]KTS91130.1 ABC transporter substrate-binding protein [Microbacterium testaceum]
MALHRRKTALFAAVAAAGALLLSGCTAGGGQSAAHLDGTQLLTIPREDMGTFDQNFNPFSNPDFPMTQVAIYESMLVFNPADGTTTPWLATDWEAADDGSGLTFHLREGVQWSDGEPLVAQDVVTSFALQKEIRGGFDYVETVTAIDDLTVEFDFNTPFSPALLDVGQQIIAPAHIWAEQSDAAKFTNPDPVGTGPYTEVTNFQAQSFDLLKNPHYWQPDKQKIEGVRMLAFAGNDGANLAAANGDVDWAPQFIPNIEQAYVAKDPEHRFFWFPTTGSMISWQFNTTKAPFDNPDVRKALSMAVDRDQVTSIGMQGYTIPADCTGLSGAYDAWRDSDVVDSCAWTKRDLDAAGELLDAAGITRGADGTRVLPDGSPFAFDFSVGSTSSDWVSVGNVISQNLAELGVTVTVAARDWAEVSASYENGTFDSGIVWSNNAPTPYQFYRGVMSTETVKPVGEQTFENYHRYGSAEADALLAQFAATSDEEQQRSIMNELQALFAEDIPVVTLFPGPEFGAATTARFTGWPNADNPYASLGAVRARSAVLILTTLEPVTG